MVRSYVISTEQPDKRSDTVVNYTIAGQHAMDEGFVLRFAELQSDDRIELVTYGEGAALKQMQALDFIWKPKVDLAWTLNPQAIFKAALAAR